ncbi:hypothetical protein GCM10023215_26180 [Pseudonocardia yuanmonensis]|uniref:Glycosyl transferase n=1 Tax=Pseudonocardia yuanmonensis TaxID=1095914 RepID=A0ABP8WJB7_9PSEU
MYLGCSLALYRRVLGGLSTSTVGWASSDSHQFTWWLEWFVHAVSTGANPLYTTYQHYPFGLNGMWNVPVPVLAALTAPVTATAGPVVAFNVAMVLGPVASGVAFVAATRRLVPRLIARAVAGGLYAFCPFVIAHASVGHLNLVWMVFPPLLIWFVDTALLRHDPRPYLTGALFGLGLALQTGLYTQTLAVGAVSLLVVAAVLALRRPALVGRRLPTLLRSTVSCLVVYFVLCAYPLYLLLAGPGRPLERIRPPDATMADAANLLFPSPLTAVRVDPAGFGERLALHPGEQGGYVGPALLLLVALALTIGVRRHVVRPVALVAAILVVLSFGVHLVVLNQVLVPVMPWRLLLDVPLLGEMEPVRLQIVIAACLALIVAVWVDDLVGRPRTVGWWAAAGLIVLVVVSWLPAPDAVRTVHTPVPAFFTRSAAQVLGPGAVVETTPRATGAWEGGAAPLLWQAESGMAYRTTGGYFIGSGPGRPLLLAGPVNAYQAGVDAIEGGAEPGPPEVARRELRQLGVSALVVVPRDGDPAASRILDWTRAVSGESGRPVDDVVLFDLAR